MPYEDASAALRRSRVPVPMVSRLVASPFSNSTAALSVVIGRGPSPRIVNLRPWSVILLGSLGTLLLGWYLVATLYLVFRDEMLSRLMSQQAELQYAYEDRLAALRNQIDRVTSRQLLDQNSLEGKVHELLSRQAQLETRQAVVATLIDQPVLAAQRPSRAAQAPQPTSSTVQSFAPLPGKPTPLADAFELRLLDRRPASAIGGPEERLKKSQAGEEPAVAAIAAAAAAADTIERRQIATLDVLDRAARENAQRLSAVFAETGLDAQRFVASSKAPQGGPLVPLHVRGQGPFETKLAQLQITLQQAERVRRIVSGLPVARPMPAEYETTSSFGARPDPFTRGLAMHTGIDFRAPSGTPVKATAPGKVVEAAYVGGYGNMVEVDHGNGVTTRYAHLSSIGVDVGDSVAKGEVLGRVGSTGRSTGPHLHYETRIDGDAADPMRFIRAGHRLAGQ
jgi:murein DD-endopeptidase MepM/ murein hydrolase activator NlpD